jgi:hypothetical protein
MRLNASGIKVSCTAFLRDGQTDFILHVIPLNLCTQPRVTVTRCTSEQTSSGRCDVSLTGKQLHYDVTVSRRPSRDWQFPEVDTWTQVHAWRHTNTASVQILHSLLYWPTPRIECSSPSIKKPTTTGSTASIIYNPSAIGTCVLLDCYQVMP